MNWKPVYWTQDRRQALRALARLELCNWLSRVVDAGSADGFSPGFSIEIPDDPRYDAYGAHETAAGYCAHEIPLSVGPWEDTAD